MLDVHALPLFLSAVFALLIVPGPDLLLISAQSVQRGARCGIACSVGVMLAGLLFGLVESLITAFLGSSYTQILTFTLVIVALAIVPNGLFGRAELKKV